MTKDKPPHDNPKISLAPLSVEEALTGLLQVAPPPEGDAPETAQEASPAKSSRKRKRTDKEEGRQ